uniref:Uncharacterized protein n=1 Tax=Esox lucius TaxID=8010 RepID=A0A6Q2YLW0_ESOLU
MDKCAVNEHITLIPSSGHHQFEYYEFSLYKQNSVLLCYLKRQIRRFYSFFMFLLFTIINSIQIICANVPFIHVNEVTGECSQSEYPRRVPPF